MASVQSDKVDTIANLFGVSVRRIQQLNQEGVLPTIETEAGRRYETIPTIQRYVRYLSDKAYGKSRSEKEAELREQKLAAEIALKESQGELHRLKTEIAAGKYVAIEEISMDYERFFVTFKNFSMAIPARIMDQLGGGIDPLEARRVEKEMVQEIRRLLKAFVDAAVTELPADKKKRKRNAG